VYYYAFPDIRTRNSNEYLSAVFTVKPGANCVERPIAGGSVGYGVLKGGQSKNYSLSEDDGKQQPPSVYTPRPPPKSAMLNHFSWIVVAALLVIFIAILWNNARMPNDEQKSQEDQESFLHLSTMRYTDE
jgi:hypothetical protein